MVYVLIILVFICVVVLMGGRMKIVEKVGKIFKKGLIKCCCFVKKGYFLYNVFIMLFYI